MASTGSRVLLLGVGFAALFPLVRFLPSTQCAFLHYQQAEAGSGDDLCGGPDASVFLDLEQLSFPVTADLVLAGLPKAGKEVSFTANFTTKAGKPITGKDLARVHTQRLHLFVIDSSLGDYHHLHPEEDIDGGDFSFRFTPRHGGRYRVYAEMVPLASRSVLVARQEVEIFGDPAPVQTGGQVPLAVVRDGLRFELKLPEGGLKRGVDNDLALLVTRLDGGAASVPFEKLMGAYCHLAAFEPTGKGFAHLHPLDKGLALETATPRFGFAFNTSLSGPYRIWAQLKLSGQEVFVPFDLKVP